MSDGPHLAPASEAGAADAPPGRKPRIALMGEFSAGKSTLTNLLLGEAPLPMQVTATQLPPVWVSEGDATPYRVALDGGRHPVDLDAVGEVSLDGTRFIRLFHEGDVLALCDLIDMPGISDPNMDPEIWRRVIAEADAVIWCTHATQAWRQSEAAVWGEMPEALHARSLLLLTRWDKIVGERDRARVLRRVTWETEGLFRGVYPVSLTRAMQAGENRETWEASGAEALLTALLDVITEIGGTGAACAQGSPAEGGATTGGATVDPGGDLRDLAADRIVPRRIAPQAAARRPRPLPEEVPPNLLGR